MEADNVDSAFSNIPAHFASVFYVHFPFALVVLSPFGFFIFQFLLSILSFIRRALVVIVVTVVKLSMKFNFQKTTRYQTMLVPGEIHQNNLLDSNHSTLIRLETIFNVHSRKLVMCKNSSKVPRIKKRIHRQTITWKSHNLMYPVVYFWKLSYCFCLKEYFPAHFGPARNCL